MDIMFSLSQRLEFMSFQRHCLEFVTIFPIIFRYFWSSIMGGEVLIRNDFRYSFWADHWGIRRQHHHKIFWNLLPHLPDGTNLGEPHLIVGVETTK